MKRLIPLILFLTLFNSCHESSTEIEDVELYFNQLWQDFDEIYSYFELKGVNWDASYDKYSPLIVNGKTNSSELEQILADMILELKDIHVVFSAGKNKYTYNNRDQFTRNSPENAKNYLSQVFHNNDNLRYGKIDNSNFAYLHIKNLSNEGNFDPLNEVLSDLPDFDGFVLDLRDNGGGNDGIAKQFVNRLTTEERIFGYYRFRNGPNHDDFQEWTARKLVPKDPILFDQPIIVLTNRFVVSSAEAFTAMMSVLPNVTIVGDTTRGSTGNPKMFEFSNGWKYHISSWQVVTVDNKFIEDNGIAPDILVSNTQESIQNGKDLMLEKAIDLL